MSAARQQNAVATWLAVCAAMVLGMTVLGGATRLTHSGLSIVEWQPIVGTLPPFGDTAWNATFDKYKQTPEYQQVNQGMSLDEFKNIFWWEYFHRLFGRVIGFVFLFPLLYFWWRGALTARLGRILVGIFVLGGLQGFMGWYMVRSGLVDVPAVSPFRLTAHLLLAIVIFGAMWWTALSLWHPRLAGSGSRPRRLGWIVTALVLYMAATGGFVAGIRAGLSHNTFPLMSGHIVPPEILLMEPWWKNFFYNMSTVQFNHRLGAWTLAVLVPVLVWRVRASGQGGRAQRAAWLLLAMLAVQVTLGITTLLWFVPVPLAVLHQGGAVVLLATALNLNHSLGRDSIGQRAEGKDQR